MLAARVIAKRAHIQADERSVDGLAGGQTVDELHGTHGGEKSFKNRAHGQCGIVCQIGTTRGVSVSDTLDLLLRRCRLPSGAGPTDLGIRAGRIVLAPPIDGAAVETIDVHGRLVTPGLVEAHIHLDKALLSDPLSATAGTLEEAIRLTGEVKRGFTREDILARARRVLDMAIVQGTTAMRAHVEVDPIVELIGLDAMLELRREYAPALDLQ